jgi:hypothetical protein
MTTNKTNRDKTTSLSTYIQELTAGEALPAMPSSTDRTWTEILKQIGAALAPVEIDEEYYRSLRDNLTPCFKQENYFCVVWGKTPFWLIWERGGRYFARRLDSQQTKLFRHLAGIETRP